MTDSSFDREINLRAIVLSGAALVLITVVAVVLMWYLLRSFESYDKRHDVRPTPIEAAHPQGPPPAPRLQVAPGFALLHPGEMAVERSDREDMRAEWEQENKILSRPGWVDQAHGTARLPIDVAMQVIAARGVAPEVVGGHAGAGTVPQVPAPQDNERAGTRQVQRKEGSL
jgi:hypothetical protein